MTACVFRTVLSDEMQGVAAANLAIELGYKTISIIYVNNPYGQGLYEKFRDAFEAAGGRVIGASRLRRRKQLLPGRAGGGHPGGLPTPCSSSATCSRAAPRSCARPSRAATPGGSCLTDGLKSLEIVEALGADVLEGTYGTAASTTSSDHFEQAYEAQYGTPPPQPYMAEAYDARLPPRHGHRKGPEHRWVCHPGRPQLAPDPNGVEVRAGDWAKAGK